MSLMKSNGTFYCVFLYRAMLRGNQHGGREYDDLRNWLDMASHENPLYVYLQNIKCSTFQLIN